jgi:hypothetical protein
MRLSLLPILTLAGCALAVPARSLITRDDSVVKYNLQRITNANLPLDQLLAAKPRFFANPQDLESYFYQVYTLGNNVVNEIRASADEVRYSKAKITDMEALNLAAISGPLETSLSNVVNALIRSKREINELNRKREITDLLTRARAETNSLFEAIISKMNVVSSVLAGGVKSKFSGIFDKGIREFR